MEFLVCVGQSDRDEAADVNASCLSHKFSLRIAKCQMYSP